MNRGSYFWRCALAAVVGLLLLGVVTMFLWNWLVPQLFNGPHITYIQALGLIVLSKILTGRIWNKQPHYPAGIHHQPSWKDRFQEKLSELQPSEREAFKQRMKEKWCSWEKSSSKTEDAND
jgi:hypothetical protein